jgi:MOSC domain-containing protein YiiM
MDASVTNLLVYPESGEPGQELDSFEMTPGGPEGNRAKKNAVHLVSVDEYVATHPRANVVLDVEAETLRDLVGRVIRVGECVLKVTRQPSNCPGVYAEVVEPGRVRVEDHLLVAES